MDNARLGAQGLLPKESGVPGQLSGFEEGSLPQKPFQPTLTAWQQSATPCESRRSPLKLSVKDLERALTKKEFSLCYQPQLEFKTNTVTGVEVLLRWHHPHWGWLSPAEFIPLAEVSGLIILIGYWVLLEACGQYQQWQAQGMAPLKLSVNLSPRQLQEPHLVHNIYKILERTQMSPTCLELEIRESYLMEDLEKMIMVLNQLRNQGISVAIDDFGTGYCSYASLKHLPIQTLKIDKSFLENLMSTTKNRMILHSIIDLGHRLKLKIVAEGVETGEQLNILKILNCDCAQGYFISYPLNAANWLDYCHSRLN